MFSLNLCFSFSGASTLPVLPPEASVAIPLRCTSWKLYLRPHGVGVGFCSQPLEWKDVLRSHTAMGYSRECYPASTATESGRRFRYKVSSVHVMLLKKVYVTKGMFTRRWGTQIGEVTCGGSPHPSCKRDQIK